MFTWLNNAFDRELERLVSLLEIDEESKSSLLKKILHYTATLVFLGVSLTILIKGTFDLKDYLMNGVLSDMPVVKGILGGIFKTSIFVAFVVLIYMFIIRVLLWLKKRIQVYEIAGFLGLIALVTNLVKNLMADNNEGFWVFSARFVAKTVGVGWDD
jgi:hypothetical protein